jgi:hypothetical protein
LGRTKRVHQRCPGKKRRGGKESIDMKLQNIKDPEKLFQVIDSCKGKVELVTGEGDRLNLKSKLSQFLSLANIFSVKEEIPELELVAYDPADVKKLIDFMINE